MNKTHNELLVRVSLPSVSALQYLPVFFYTQKVQRPFCLFAWVFANQNRFADYFPGIRGVFPVECNNRRIFWPPFNQWGKGTISYITEMASTGFPSSQSVLLIYPASKASLVYFIWLSEIPASAQFSLGRWPGPRQAPFCLSRCRQSGGSVRL